MSAFKEECHPTLSTAIDNEVFTHAFLDEMMCRAIRAQEEKTYAKAAKRAQLSQPRALDFA